MRQFRQKLKMRNKHLNLDGLISNFVIFPDEFRSPGSPPDLLLATPENTRLQNSRNQFFETPDIAQLNLSENPPERQRTENASNTTSQKSKKRTEELLTGRTKTQCSNSTRTKPVFLEKYQFYLCSFR